MIKPDYNKFWIKFFLFFATIQLRLHFQKMVFKGKFFDEGKPILLIANHFSFWDGFIQSKMNQKIFKRRLFYMMLWDELQKRRFLRKTGAYSMEKGTRGIVESLNFSVELLRENQNLLLLFPQGEIQSMHRDKLSFGRGVEYILERVKTNCQVVFNVNLPDYHSYKKPVLYMYFRSYEVGFADRKTLESDFQEFYDACKKEQSQL